MLYVFVSFEKIISMCVYVCLCINHMCALVLMEARKGCYPLGVKLHTVVRHHVVF